MIEDKISALEAKEREDHLQPFTLPTHASLPLKLILSFGATGEYKPAIPYPRQPVVFLISSEHIPDKVDDAKCYELLITKDERIGRNLYFVRFTFSF